MKKELNSKQIQMASSLTRFKKRKSMFWNNILWFLLGFVLCGAMTIWLL